MYAQNQNDIDGEDGKGMETEIQRCLPLKKRYPTCARCRNHGLILDVKGHKRTCEYRECCCSRCNLVSQRRMVMAKQVALSREQVRQDRRNRDPSDQQLPQSQRFFQESPTHPQPPPHPHPEVIDLTSERPVTEELPYPVVQPSPDSTNTCTNIGYCSSPYSSWEFSRENTSQPTEMTSSPQTLSGQAPQSYPSSFNSSQIHVDDTYRSRMAFTSNHLGRPIISSHAVTCNQSNDPTVAYRHDRITGAVPLDDMPSSQRNVGVASQIYPPPLHPYQVDGTCRSRGSFSADQMVRPRPMLSHESMNALPGYRPYHLPTPSVNFSSPHSAFGVGSQYCPSSFQLSQVDASYRCHVSMTTNHTVRPSAMTHQQSNGAVPAYCGNCPSSHCNSTVATSFHARDAAQSMCYCNVTDQAHWYPQLASHVSSSRVAPFEEGAASTSMTSAYPPSIMTTQTNCIHPYQHQTYQMRPVMPIPYAFQTPDEPPMYLQNDNANEENSPTFPSQVADTPHQSQVMPSVQTDYSAVRRPQVETTSHQSQGMLPGQSDHMLFSVRRPQVPTNHQQPKVMPFVHSDYTAVLPQEASTSQQPQAMSTVQSSLSSVRPLQETITSHQPPGISPVQSDSSVRSEVVTTSPKPCDVSSVQSGEPSYRSRRPFPLRITIPSLQMNRSNCSDTPIDPSPTFSPSTLSLLTNVTLPTSDIPSPGFFASSLPTFNYPSPTLPTQSSPVFSYPSPFTNPLLHAGAPSFQDPVESQLPTRHSTSNLSEQIRIPPKYDDDLDGDREGSEIDVCSLDQYSYH